MITRKRVKKSEHLKSFFNAVFCQNVLSNEYMKPYGI